MSYKFKLADGRVGFTTNDTQGVMDTGRVIQLDEWKPTPIPSKVWVNMLVKIGCADDEVLFKAAIESVAPVVDGIFLLDSTNNGEAIRLIPEALRTSINVQRVHPDFCVTTGFANARNLLLSKVPIGDYMLWMDSDECHFPNQLKELLDHTVQQNYDQVSTHFIHFCLGSNGYERFERRYNILRNFPGSHWEGQVHERFIQGCEAPRIFHSDYSYHHYGYVRDQSYVFDRWKQYAILEGQANPYRFEEEGGKTVPYFREGREGPDKILEDRRATLLPYFGEYPPTLPETWVRSKRIALT